MRFLLSSMILFANATSKTMDAPQASSINMKELFAGSVLFSDDLTTRSSFIVKSHFKSLESAVVKCPQLHEWDKCLKLINFISRQTGYTDSYIAHIVAPIVPSA